MREPPGHEGAYLGDTVNDVSLGHHEGGHPGSGDGGADGVPGRV